MTIEITDETRYEAIDAGMAAIGYQRNPDVPRGEGATHVAEEAIAVAIDHLLPIIEQAVREQCAAEIEAVMIKEAPGKVHNDPVVYMRNIGFQRGLKHAARIVREEE